MPGRETMRKSQTLDEPRAKKMGLEAYLGKANVVERQTLLMLMRIT